VPWAAVRPGTTFNSPQKIHFRSSFFFLCLRVLTRTLSTCRCAICRRTLPGSRRQNDEVHTICTLRRSVAPVLRLSPLPLLISETWTQVVIRVRGRRVEAQWGLHCRLFCTLRTVRNSALWLCKECERDLSKSQFYISPVSAVAKLQVRTLRVCCVAIAARLLLLNTEGFPDSAELTLTV
jgi:hypothetical protein